MHTYLPSTFVLIFFSNIFYPSGQAVLPQKQLVIYLFKACISPIICRQIGFCIRVCQVKGHLPYKLWPCFTLTGCCNNWSGGRSLRSRCCSDNIFQCILRCRRPTVIDQRPIASSFDLEKKKKSFVISGKNSWKKNVIFWQHCLIKAVKNWNSLRNLSAACSAFQLHDSLLSPRIIAPCSAAGLSQYSVLSWRSCGVLQRTENLR